MLRRLMNLVHAARTAAARSLGAGRNFAGKRVAGGAAFHADARRRDKAHVFCRVALRTDNVIFDFTYLVEHIIGISAIGALIVVNRHEKLSYYYICDHVLIDAAIAY
jgi:hypothetical protein